jgi:methylmalonyl-CoA/ethylmalonyl-CoA epimerase
MIKINHIAVAVADLEEATAFWVDALGLPLAESADVPAEAVRVAFLRAAEGTIELVQPTTAGSGIARYLEKRGPGMHHICLEVDELAATLDRLRAQGVELINEQPRVNREGRKYAFIHPRSTGGVLLELYEAEEGAG